MCYFLLRAIKFNYNLLANVTTKLNLIGEITSKKLHRSVC